MATILFVDDEPAVGLLLEDALGRAGHRPVGVRNVPEALQILARDEAAVDLIISDYGVERTGLELLDILRREGRDIPLIMLTGYGSIEHALTAIRAGAIDCVTKPLRAEQLELAVAQALELVRLRTENALLRSEVMRLRNAAGGAHVVELPSLNVGDAERVLIQRALIAAGQNRTRAAALLGISVRTLRNKLNVRVETASSTGDGGIS
jgi:DNA-binding NtrC family response regulator